MAKWNTVHRPGYKWTLFRAKLLDERGHIVTKVRVLLYPLSPESSCVVFSVLYKDSERACYDRKTIKKAIKFGLPVQIEASVMKPRPIEHHYDH